VTGGLPMPRSMDPRGGGGDSRIRWPGTSTISSRREQDEGTIVGMVLTCSSFAR
jgi:hypothetical protein